jgi:uncharacterized protein YjbI with pentapeptide repeats
MIQFTCPHCSRATAISRGGDRPQSVRGLIQDYREGHRDFRGVYLRLADLRDVHLEDADLRHADLSRANLTGADLRGVDLSGADLRGAVLSHARLNGADLSGADLRGADFTGADLEGADLSRVEMARATWRQAKLDAAILDQSRLAALVTERPRPRTPTVAEAPAPAKSAPVEADEATGPVAWRIRRSGGRYSFVPCRVLQRRKADGTAQISVRPEHLPEEDRLELLRRFMEPEASFEAPDGTMVLYEFRWEEEEGPFSIRVRQDAVVPLPPAGG